MSGNRFFVSVTQNGLTRNYSIRLLLIKNIKRETWKGGQVENKTVKKVYEVEEIQNILGISRSAAYELIRETYKMQHFKVLKIGNLYRVPKVPFDNWLNGETE
jgi:predicted DNA-binding transcriptional regulator AlpA